MNKKKLVKKTVKKVNKKPTKSVFFDKITKIVEQSSCSYLEALARYAEDNNITDRKMARMLCPKLKEQVEYEVKFSRKFILKGKNHEKNKRA